MAAVVAAMNRVRPCVAVEEMFRQLDGHFGRLAYWAYTDEDDPSRVLVRGHYSYIPEAEQFLREQGFNPVRLDGNTVVLNAREVGERRRSHPMTDEVRDYWFARTRTIRVMSDYSSSPLWGDVGNLGADGLGLSDDLVTRLDEWQAIFDWNFHYETGWNSEVNHQRYNALGRELLPLVSAELPGYIVELHLWQGDEETVERAGGWLPGWTPPPREEDGTWTAYVPLNDPLE